MLQDEKDPLSAQTASVSDALRLGCVGIGYTIYPGTAERRLQYEQLRELVRKAKSVGLVVVVWSYPRGSGLSKDGETALEVAATLLKLRHNWVHTSLRSSCPLYILNWTQLKKSTRRMASHERRWHSGLGTWFKARSTGVGL